MSGSAVGSPWVIGAAVLLLLAVEAWRRRRRAPPGLAFADVAWLEGLPRSGRDRLARALPWWRRGLILLVGWTLADPVLARRAAEEETRGIDVLVALDQSSSMTVVLPGAFASRRFDAALAAIERFAAGRSGDRIGLTAFAKYPRLRCPLTWDHALFREQLATTATIHEMSEDLTAIGVALADGATRLEGGAATRVLVLVTDGANNSGSIEPREGAALCRAAGVRVYAIALGGGEEFGSGRPAPDHALLRELAGSTGGVAFQATDEAGLAAAWRTIDALERTPIVRRDGIVIEPLATAGVLALLLVLLLGAAAARVAVRSLP